MTFRLRNSPVRLLGKIALTSVIALSSAIIAHGDTLDDWTFETSMPNGTGTDNGPYAPDGGILTLGAGASGHHASASTAWSTISGNGSLSAYNSNHWGVNDYWQFTLTTLGYNDITVSYAQEGSSTGPANFQFQYSTDGTSFTNFGSAYSLTSSTSYKTSSFDLSMVPGVNTAPTVYFRVLDTSTTAIGGGSVGAAGSDHIDDFVVSGLIAIPEPSVYMLLGIGLLVCAQRFLRGRNSS
jgi:hypothetical protein